MVIGIGIVSFYRYIILWGFVFIRKKKVMIGKKGKENICMI